MLSARQQVRLDGTKLGLHESLAQHVHVEECARLLQELGRDVHRMRAAAPGRIRGCLHRRGRGAAVGREAIKIAVRHCREALWRHGHGTVEGGRRRRRAPAATVTAAAAAVLPVLLAAILRLVVRVLVNVRRTGTVVSAAV